MDNTSTTLDALERTAAWVQQVQSQAEKMKHCIDVDVDPNDEDCHMVSEEEVKIEPSDRDDNSLTDHHDEAMKAKQKYSPYSAKNQNNIGYEHIDIKETVQEFKKALEKFGISQRFASSYIMENTSQGNLSFLLDKGKTKQWAEISPRGRIPYIRMRRWLDSPEEQKATMEQLYKNKDFKKGVQVNGVMVPKREKREKFSLFQLLVLCRVFEEDNNPSLSTRSLLADKLEAPLERITIWFQNQRARNFPAKKLLKESTMFRESPGMKALTELTSKKNCGMKQSNTPLKLTTGHESTSCSTTASSQGLNSTKPSATITQEQEAKIQSCVNSVLSSSTIPNITATSTFSNPLAFPMPLMNMAQSLKVDPIMATSTSAGGQLFAPFLGLGQNIFTSMPSSIQDAAAEAVQALNLMKSNAPMILKTEVKGSEEPCDLSAVQKNN